MDITTIVPQIVNAVRHERNKLSLQNPVVEITADAWSRMVGGEKFYSIKFAGHEFRTPDASPYHVFDFGKAIEEAAAILSKKRGYHISVIRKPFYYQTRDFWGMVTESETIPLGIALLTAPCQDFVTLAKTLEKACGLTVNPTDLYSVSVVGKRGRDYRESGQKNFFAYDIGKCKKVIDWIRENKKAGNILRASIESLIDAEDRDYSIRHETESYGTKHQYLLLTLFTNGGKKKKEFPTLYI